MTELTAWPTGGPALVTPHPIFDEKVIINHRGLRREYARDELAAAAEKLLADRVANDARAVERGHFTPDQARQRERCARAVAETMRAVAEQRDPGDADKTWFETQGAEGAGWWEVRADLASMFQNARTKALANRDNPALEQRALKIAALASWFEPARHGGHMPAILFAFHIEQHFDRQREAKANAAPAPLPPRAQRVGAQPAGKLL
ncbi:hypothetical protein [Sphingomonas sp. MS122]|uniref:hypothetical protein n=1 Tax=Sphingomonas sp. MS122 TaxID=3412683 RepID=UPI003C3002B1